jgi:hypothetical protein
VDGAYIAYQDFGGGERTLVVIHGWISHLELYPGADVDRRCHDEEDRVTDEVAPARLRHDDEREMYEAR